MKLKRTTALLAVMALLLTACADTTQSSVEESTPASVTESTPASVTESTPLSGATAEASPAETAEPEGGEAFNDSVVRFSHASGVYGEGFTLELTATDGTVYFTTDGSDPRTSESRTEYAAGISVRGRSGDKNVVSAVDPLLVAGNFNYYSDSQNEFVSTVIAPQDSAVDKITVIRAAARSADGSWSQTFSGSFFVGAVSEHIAGIEESAAAAGDLAVISISMDYGDLFDSERGIYVKGDIFAHALEEYIASGERLEDETARALDANYKQRGRAWERPCHVDFFEMNGEGARLALSQDCGVRIQGNYSRSDWQKGLRLFARGDYGDKRFRYPVFGEELTDSSGEVINSFKTLVLRAGGNCAFTSKFNDTFWQEASAGMDCAVKRSRPCVVYLNGEYWGLYVLEEDYSDNYFEDHYGVDNKSVVVYKGDGEALELGYALDEGELPEGVTDESWYFRELLDFFRTHTDLVSQEDYSEFARLVDTDSVRDYFLAQVWINNKWDWPGKNWSMWKVTEPAEDNEYADGRWRFMFYDMELGGVCGEGEAYTNTVREDNYKPLGLLDMETDNPAVLCFAYLMTNADFRADFNARLNALSEGDFSAERLNALLDEYVAAYGPLFGQFFERYPESGSADEAINGGYGTPLCIRQFVAKRGGYVPKITKWIDRQFAE